MDQAIQNVEKRGHPFEGAQFIPPGRHCVQGKLASPYLQDRANVIVPKSQCQYLALLFDLPAGAVFLAAFLRRDPPAALAQMLFEFVQMRDTHAYPP
jgi:hypothetical protein